jgi:hypothetical protein
MRTAAAGIATTGAAAAAAIPTIATVVASASGVTVGVIHRSAAVWVWIGNDQADRARQADGLEEDF